MSAEVKPECAPEHPLPSAFITQTPSQLHSELGTCFEPGDVVWAYVKGHPWWPAVVSEDDLGGDEERLWYQSKGNKYHVQYLGPLLEHQWITPARLVRFISKQQFDDHLKSLEKKSSAGRVCPRHKEKWDLAVEEANRFLKAADKVAMLNKKLVDAEEEREQNKENQKNLSLKVCIYDSQTYVLNEKAFKNVNKRFRDKDSSCTNKLALVCEKIEISNEDLESIEALKLNADCIFRLKIEELGEQRKTKSLSSSSEISEKVESRRARNCSESSSISSSLKSFEGTTGNFKLMLDVEIVEALKSSKWKLKQLIMKHQGKLAERLVLKMKMSPKSKEKESKLVSRKSETLSLLTLKEAVAFLGDDGKSPIKRSLDKIQRQIEKQQLKEKSMNDQTEKGPRTSRAVAVPERELKPVEIVDPLKLLYLDPNTKDKICLKCEGEGKQMISCVDCLDCYHPSCLPSEETEQIEPKEGFKCAKCKSGLKLCFSCHDSILGLQDSELFQCTVSNCRKMYHLACLDKYPALNENFGSPNKKRDKCPQHLCASCFPHDTAANKVCFVGKTIKCLKCPLAYHSGKNEELLRCVPAGSSLLSNHFLICPAHFATATGNQKQKQKFAKKLHKMHLNVHWCFLCGTGGDLVVCEMCPAAFHPHCVKLKTKPDHSEQPFYCESCMAGILPRFGDIVWVKCGNYRWWPAKIVHPEELPENIYKKNHEEGDFAVQFFGSRDFMWTSLGRVFLFEENDTASKGTNNHLSMVFQKGLKEATDAFRDLTAQRERELIERVNGTSGKIPAPYKYVTRNIPQGNVKVYKADLDNYATCTCKEDDLDPCGPSSNCENRYTMIECHPKLCKAGDRCRNQRFARAEYAETYYFKCGDRGWGLKNKTTIQTGQFVNEYCGDLITYEEYERRLKYQNDRSELDFYFCVLDSKRVIDAKPKGCHSRFMNHSCDPNCYGQLWTVNGDIRVGLFAIREIPPDSELTFNYNLSSLGQCKLNSTSVFSPDTY